ncbi:MAG: 3-carboxymuconate cyclase [Chthoniobacteraceae bacterium]|nr:3-carboxymuconate cyclase [Chthoniobacteraceae bacterium]
MKFTFPFFLGAMALLALLFRAPTVQAVPYEVLFSADAKGSSPLCDLIQGSDGTFYGTTNSGGTSGLGTVFKMTPAGNLTTLISLTANTGSRSGAGLVAGSDGNFYGTARNGGAGNLGTVFKITPAGVLTTLVVFNSVNGASPAGRLVAGNDGSFYGTTFNGGPSDAGTVFKMTPDGALTTLAVFGGSNGAKPTAALLLGSDGNFYGTTSSGGASDRGTIFKMTPSGALTTLVSFNLANGAYPSGELVEGSDGRFYGTADSISGPKGTGRGTVFAVSSAGELTTLAIFNEPNGLGPNGRLVVGSDGNFYGTTEGGGANNAGTVFRMTPTGALTTLVNFKLLNGYGPSAGLLIGKDGDFYGTTTFGGASSVDGAYGIGTVFKMTPAGVLTTLNSFTRPGGSFPNAGLVEGPDHSLYGTTAAGGLNGAGTVFRTTPEGVTTTLASFDTLNGAGPSAGLVLGSDGNFYGTTYRGGLQIPHASYGTVFRMTPAGTLTTLVQFNYTNGANPIAGLTEGSDGNFYGTTSAGGVTGNGTVFKVTPSGALTTLISFDRNKGGPDSPRAGLLLASDGNFYGTTTSGGSGGQGIIFKMTPSGALTTLVSFDYHKKEYPSGKLIEGSDGTFYGTTYFGGIPAVGYDEGCGTIFKMTPSGVLTTLAAFNLINGANPGELVMGAGGNLYGTTYSGGADNSGTVFRLTPDGNLSTLHSFDGTRAVHPPGGPLHFDSNGNLYGTAAQMILWRIAPASAPAALTVFSTGITASGATVAATVAPSGEDSTVLFEYGVTNSYGNTVSSSPSVLTGNAAVIASAVLSSLQPGTTYHFRAVVSNRAATTQGADATFTTAPYSDGPSRFQQWKLSNLGDVNAPDLGHGDGGELTNLAKYALVLPPGAPGAGPRPAVTQYAEGRRLRLIFQRDPARNDITIEVQATSDLALPWITLARSVNGGIMTGIGYVGGDDAGPAPKSIEVRDTVDATSSKQRFMRVHVTH